MPACGQARVVGFRAGYARFFLMDAISADHGHAAACTHARAPLRIIRRGTLCCRESRRQWTPGERAGATYASPLAIRARAIPALLTGSARKPCVRASENATRAFLGVRSSWGGDGNTVASPASTGIQVRTGQHRYAMMCGCSTRPYGYGATGVGGFQTRPYQP